MPSKLACGKSRYLISIFRTSAPGTRCFVSFTNRSDTSIAVTLYPNRENFSVSIPGPQPQSRILRPIRHSLKELLSLWLYKFVGPLEVTIVVLRAFVVCLLDMPVIRVFRFHVDILAAGQSSIESKMNGPPNVAAISFGTFDQLASHALIEHPGDPFGNVLRSGYGAGAGARTRTGRFASFVSDLEWTALDN